MRKMMMQDTDTFPQQSYYVKKTVKNDYDDARDYNKQFSLESHFYKEHNK